MPESAMPTATMDTAVSIPAMSLDSPSDNAMTALYRIALGPVNTAHYLPIFARFDTMGRAMGSWNWTACLFTLSWMVFRQLWGAALIYVAAAEGLALLVFGLGRSLLKWPSSVEWGILAAIFLLGCAIPGLYGNVILHTDTRKKIARALAAARTLPQACALLEQQASSRRRLGWVALAHSALICAAALSYLVWPQARLSGSPKAPEPTATLKPSAPKAVASAVADVAPSAAPAAQSAASSSFSQSANVAAIPFADPASVAPHATASHLVYQGPSAALAASEPVMGSQPGYYINVGLFSEEANARKVQSRLLNEGWPAFRQELAKSSSKKPRTRVRVGPFETRAQADAVAASIQAMSLEAVVFKQ